MAAPRVKARRSERGDVMAWFAMLILLVGVPLASLSIDITRLMYVRTHLQAASDAACQAAADALDVRAFRDSGTARIEPGLARSQASQVFSATVADAGRVQFSPSLSLSLLSPLVVRCSATASVVPMIPITPALTVRVTTTSELRVSTR